MGAHENLGVFSDAQVIAAAAASTNTIDLDQPNAPRIGVGDHAPYLCIRVAVPNTAEPADTISIELQADDDDGSGDPTGTWTHVVMSPLVGPAGAEVVVTDARLATAGAWIFRGQLPYDIPYRHIRLYYNNTTSDDDIHIDAWLEDGPASDFRGSQVIKSDVGQP